MTDIFKPMPMTSAVTAAERLSSGHDTVTKFLNLAHNPDENLEIWVLAETNSKPAQHILGVFFADKDFCHALKKAFDEAAILSAKGIYMEKVNPLTNCAQNLVEDCNKDNEAFTNALHRPERKHDCLAVEDCECQRAASATAGHSTAASTQICDDDLCDDATLKAVIMRNLM